MADAVRTTPDIPNFDVYPGGVGPERELPEQGSVTQGRGGAPAGIRMPRPGQERLTDAAESVGGAVGSAISRVRKVPQQLRDRFRVIRGRGSEVANRRTEELKGAASEQLRRARTRAEYVTREYPLHVIAGAAALGLLAGVGLRLWRSNRG